MKRQTRVCSIQDFRPEFAAQIRRYVSNSEEILVCYETKGELDIGGGLFGGEKYYHAQVLTQDQMITAGEYGKRQHIVSVRLVDISNIYESGGNSDFRVQVSQHGQFSLEFFFASQQLAQQFADILRQAVEQAKKSSVPPHSQPSSSIKERLRALIELHDNSLISDAEFQQKRQEILRGI